ncbi:MAG: translation initiation factor IF-2 [Planctomycetes bacterium]|nr:translation initiation factor IF-2 [Planctomycetota bacterium]
MAKRIFELARELGVTSKTVLGKCRAEGLEIKNHMSTVSVGLEATIREWFSEQAESHTAVETAAHVDLKKARAQARKRRRKQAAPAAASQEQAGGGEAPAAEQAGEPATATAVAEAAPQTQPQAGPAPSEAATAVAAEATAAEETTAEQPPAAEQAPAAAAQQQPAVKTPQQPAAAATAGEPAAAAEAPPAEQAEAAPAGEEEPKEPEKPKKPEIKPAGPQLVPRPAKLTGPRVVRVEAPEYDYMRRPPRRRPPGPATPAAGPATAGPERRGRATPAAAAIGAPSRKKTKRRSPRRRTGSGRSADSGDKIKEWRERDLQERSARLAAASGGGLRRHRASVGRKGALAGRTAVRRGKVEIEEPITVKSLSAATGLKTADIIRRLMALGMMATINQHLDADVAESLCADFDIELEIHHAKTAEEELVERLKARPAGRREPRAPVVTFLGHVDHGKTSLLDRIRRTSVAPGEAGGITQHIGAYRYEAEGRSVVFLDTPGHEAFTAMRARGANMTDVVVLVVAADDGVMPQTIEAISHARAAKVPIVVALNKVDVPNANVQRAMSQLAEQGLQPRQWGGQVEVIETSAATGQGIEELVETLSLEAELLELTAEVDAPASGFIIEAKVDASRGALATLLVLNGTLKVGDVVLAGTGHGRVRQILDDRGREIKQAGPATPVEIAGLDEAPEAGDRFYVLDDIDEARAVAEDRRRRMRAEQLASGPRATLESLFSQIRQGEKVELPLIVKADVQGSVEAVTGSLNKLSTDEAKVNILHAGVGGISTGDVTLAEASGAMIIGFNVVPDAAARQLAEQTGVDIRLYRVIYEAIDDVRQALAEGLAPEIRQETLGRAEVRQIFRVSRVGTIAGCLVTDGVVNRHAMVRIIRNSVVVEDGRSLESLKRFKDDAREVRAGLECGLKIAGYDDVKEGDVLEFYRNVEVARTL